MARRKSIPWWEQERPQYRDIRYLAEDRRTGNQQECIEAWHGDDASFIEMRERLSPHCRVISILA